MRCELFDSAGGANPPLLIVVHAIVGQKYGISSQSARKRNLLAAVLLLAAPLMFWWDWTLQWTLVMPTLFGITMILGAVRLLLSNLPRRDYLQEQKERLSAHVDRERNLSGG